MTTDRFEITEDAWGEPLINGSRAIMWSDTALIGAIRQQASDIDQLRADLAAAVAERDEWCRRAKLAEAELAVIELAPTVACAENMGAK